jgi:hypothetical protein
MGWREGGGRRRRKIVKVAAAGPVGNCVSQAVCILFAFPLAAGPCMQQQLKLPLVSGSCHTSVKLGSTLVIK